MKHFFTSRFFPFFVLAMLISFTANAGSVYKWTDENGVVHYGDKRPENTETKKLKVKVGKGTPGPAAKNSKSVDEAQSEEKNGGNGEASTAQKKKLDDACKRARENLATMKTYARIKTKDENGEYRFLSPEEKSEKEAEARKFVDEKCK